MPEFQKIRKELKPGTLPGSGKEILEYLENNEASFSDLEEELNYSRTTIRRWAVFYREQKIIQQTEEKDLERGNIEKFYKLSPKYREK